MKSLLAVLQVLMKKLRITKTKSGKRGINMLNLLKRSRTLKNRSRTWKKSSLTRMKTQIHMPIKSLKKTWASRFNKKTKNSSKHTKRRSGLRKKPTWRLSSWQVRSAKQTRSVTRLRANTKELSRKCKQQSISKVVTKGEVRRKRAHSRKKMAYWSKCISP